MEVEIDGFKVSSNFDSGNLQRIEKVDPGSVSFEAQSPDDLCAHEFNCWIKPDCGGTEYENNNRTWFHFSFTGGPPFATVRFNIMNMNRQGKLYAQGMKTVYKVDPLFPEWKRLTDNHLFKVGDEGNFIMSFKYYTLEDSRCITYFAFSFPLSYIELQSQLNSRDLEFRMSPPASIYYHRELITYSLDGRRVDLLTISAASGGDGREVRLPGLFPLASSELRAVRFPGRKVVLLSARVHPGETPSSFVLDGCLRLLLSTTSKAADRLRHKFVFKVIPMLNPDGVARGHYRTNIHGSNLNRMYTDPSRSLYPEIYAAKSVALYHHLGRVPADCELMESEPSAAELDALFVRPRDIGGAGALDLSASGGTSVASGTPDTPRSRSGLEEVSNDSAYGKVPAPPRPPPPQPEDVSNDASCIAGDTDEYSLGMPDLSPLKSLLQLTPRRAAAETCIQSARQTELTGSDSESLVSSADADPASVVSSASSVSVQQPGKESPVPAPVPSPAAERRAAETKAEDSTGTESNLFLYVDMHGHASKRGCFMYGNHFSGEEMIDCMLLPKLVSLNSPNFDFLACNFTEKNMHHKGKRDGLSKEGSGRVALFRATGLIRSYTLECNYNTGRFRNVVPPAPGEPDLPPHVPLVYTPLPYTAAEYREVGEAMMLSLLDLVGEHPQSRLPRSEYRDLEGVRLWIRRFLQITKFGENNMTFSPEKTARTMKSHPVDKLRQMSNASRESASARRGGHHTVGGGTNTGGIQRRATLAPPPAAAETKDKRRPVKKPRRGKAKKLSPGKVEDQENAVVAPRKKRSADALLTAASHKVESGADSRAETTSLAGPSRLRVKSPVLQPKLGQHTSPGHAPPGLSRPPTVRRALSEKRRVLKPSPIRLGDGHAASAGAGAVKTAAAANVRRSASLVTRQSLAGEQAEQPLQEQLQLSAAASPATAAAGKSGAAAGKRVGGKRKKRASTAAADGAGTGVRVQDTLPPCRSLGHLIQLVSSPPVSFSSLFQSSASASELQAAAEVPPATLGSATVTSGVTGSVWASRSELDLLQDDAAELPPESLSLDSKSADASPLSFAGALSSASNSPRPLSPKSPADSGKLLESSPKASSESAKLVFDSPRPFSDSPRTSPRSPSGFVPHSAPVSPQEFANISTSTLSSPRALSPQPSSSRRVGKLRTGIAKTRCATRKTAKKTAKSLQRLTKRSQATTSGGKADAAATKTTRTKLARRASAPLCKLDKAIISALDQLEPSGGLKISELAATEVGKTKAAKLRVKKSRSASGTAAAGSASLFTTTVGCSSACEALLNASEGAPPRRSASEGAAAAPAGSAGFSAPAKCKGVRLVKRAAAERVERARVTGLQPARKRKKAKDKT